jgi:hypothetical protein
MSLIGMRISFVDVFKFIVRITLPLMSVMLQLIKFVTNVKLRKLILLLIY